MSANPLPLISVVLPVYNQERFIAQTIDSVLAQDYQNFELLLHDDGSKDDSARILREYAASDPRIKASFAPNAGRSAATNRLMAEAKGEWCAFIDADDLMLPQRLSRQVAFHQEHPEVDASSCHCMYINEKGKDLGTQRWPGLRTAEEGKEAFEKHQLVQCAITGLMISREAYAKTGGLDNKYWPCDDLEFSNRLLELGLTLVIIQEVLMKYRIHATAITQSNPLYTYDKVGYIIECIERRRAGLPEGTYEDFAAVRARDPWWVKMNRKRYNYAQIYYRNAGIALMSKDYLKFGWQLGVSSILSPNHLVQKGKSLVRKG
jgi:glycosyltransferase involved in cell wall biosynthesis